MGGKKELEMSNRQGAINTTGLALGLRHPLVREWKTQQKQNGWSAFILVFRAATSRAPGEHSFFRIPSTRQAVHHGSQLHHYAA